MSDETEERELPAGVARKQIGVSIQIRDYIKRIANEEDRTMSAVVHDILPGHWENKVHRVVDDDYVIMKVTPEADSKVDHMAGERIDKGEILAYYAFLEAMRRGDIEEGTELLKLASELAVGEGL